MVSGRYMFTGKIEKNVTAKWRIYKYWFSRTQGILFLTLPSGFPWNIATFRSSRRQESFHIFISMMSQRSDGNIIFFLDCFHTKTFARISDRFVRIYCLCNTNRPIVRSNIDQYKQICSLFVYMHIFLLRSILEINKNHSILSTIILNRTDNPILFFSGNDKHFKLLN